MNWHFYLTSDLSGCCGYMQAQCGSTYQHRGYRTVQQLLSFGKPVVFATTVNDSYYQHVLDECKRLDLRCVETPQYVNPGSGNKVGMIVVYPKNLPVYEPT